MQKTTQLLLCLFLIVSCQPKQQQKVGKNPDPAIIEQEVPDLLGYIKSNNIASNALQIRIDKSDKILAVIHKEMVLKTYPVALGSSKLDDKLQEGDNLTPEGIFYIQSKYPHKKWQYFMWLNYPTAASWKKHNQAKKEGKIGKNASIGGEVGIHGVVKGRDFLVSTGIPWTKGCISLKNKDLEIIYQIIGKKTPIYIQK